MKLKAKEVKTTRLDLRSKQGMKCALCKLPVSEAEAVLDHCHKTGAIRATLHRGCNSLLGRVENNAPRYRVDVLAFAQGLGEYLATHKTNQTGLLHPSHRTPEEKKLLAKKRRARKKPTTR